MPNQVLAANDGNEREALPNGPERSRLTIIGGEPVFYRRFRKLLKGTATGDTGGPNPPQTISTTTFTSALGFPKVIPNNESRTILITTSGRWNRNTSSNNIEFQLLVNGSVVDFIEIEAKDSAGSFGATGTDQKVDLKTLIDATVPASDITIGFQFRGESSSPASLWDLRILIEEIDDADII